MGQLDGGAGIGACWTAHVAQMYDLTSHGG
jgi:hypothetical protein